MEFHPITSDDRPSVALRSTFIDHRATIGKVRQDTTWTYKRKDGVKQAKYRRERWRVKNPDGSITNKAHYIGRVEEGQFIPSSGKRTETLCRDRILVG